MTTSNSIDFNVTRDDIITEAYEQLGVLGEGEAPNSDQITSASRTLNMMIKTWQADGLQLFAVERCVLFIEPGTQKYSLVNTTANHFLKESDLNTTSTSSSALTGASTIDVDNTTGINDGDYIGVAYGTSLQWTTVNGAPAGNTVTLTDVLVADIADGATVYSYTTKANRPMQVMEGYIHQTLNGVDIPLGNLSRRKYDMLSNKTNNGTPNQFYYDKQRQTGDLYVWPTGSSSLNYILMAVQRTLDDVDAGTDDLDFPQEWFLPLAINLAVLIAPKVGAPRDIYSELANQGFRWYEICKDWDDELYTSIYFQPDFRGEDI